MLFLLMLQYLLEAALTAAIFIGAVEVTYLAIKAVRMAHSAIHRKN